MPLFDFGPNETIDEKSRFVWWAMVFPDNHNRAFEGFVRDSVFAQVESDGLSGQDDFTMPVTWLHALANCPDPETLKAEVARRQQSGVTAGAVLLISHLSETLGAPIRFNTAVEVLMTAEERKGLGRPLDSIPFTNKAQVSAAWLQMRPVAHLWAALCVIDIATTAAVMPKTPGRVQDVLALAAWFGDWGKVRRMGRGKQSAYVLDPDSMWDFALAEPRMTLPPIERYQLTQWLAETIEARATKSDRKRNR